MSPKPTLQEIGLQKIARLREKRAADSREYVTMKEVTLLLGKGETSIREAMDAGKLKSIKDGGARYFCRDSVLEYDIARHEVSYGLVPSPPLDGRRSTLERVRPDRKKRKAQDDVAE